jgi:tRNA(fMet)-specific endonuclease VapC
MNYLLDTCVISDFIRGEKNTLARLKSVSPNHIAVSSITVMEIEYGLALNLSLAKKIRPVIHAFLESINILAFNSDDAKAAALIRAMLKEQGTPIGSYDILLAGCAMNHNLTFVSANIKEFIHIKTLTLENWRT